MRSKKIHILTLLAALLAVLGIVFQAVSSAKMTASADAVEFTQLASYGDPAAADGITLSTQAKTFGTGITWMSNIRFSRDGMSANSAHTYSANDTGMSSALHRDSFNTEIRILVDFYLCKNLRDYAQELGKTMEPGDVKEVEIDLSDFMDCYPLCMDAARVPFSIYTAYDVESRGDLEVLFSRINGWLQENIRIPVPEGEKATLRIATYDNGRVDYSVLLDDKYGNPYGARFAAFGDAVDKTCYIYIYPDEPAKSAVAPGGAVYRIPSAEQYGVLAPDVDRAEVLYYNDPGFATTFADIRAGRLQAVADDGSSVKAYVTDLSSGKMVSADVCRISEGQRYVGYFKDDYLVVDVLGDAYYCVSQGSGGALQLTRFSQSSAFEQTSEFKEAHEKFYCSDVIFAGGRLAVAGNWSRIPVNKIDQYNWRAEYGGVYFSCYTQEGLKYHGRWESSLSNVQYHGSGGVLFGEGYQDELYVRFN